MGKTVNALLLWALLLPVTLWGSVCDSLPLFECTPATLFECAKPVKFELETPVTPHYTVLRWGWLGGVTASFVGGGAWGLHEKRSHHWQQFHARFPNANPDFWGPDSWLNKYNNRDPKQGRTNVPVVFTDAKHLLASTALASGFVAGASFTIGAVRPWWHYGLDFIAGSFAWWIGNKITFNWIYKQ